MLVLTSVRDYDAVQAEHTMVDGIIEIRVRHKGVRTIRELEVAKLRGSAYLEGRHTYRIARDGVVSARRGAPRADAAFELRGASALLDRDR